MTHTTQLSHFGEDIELCYKANTGAFAITLGALALAVVALAPRNRKRIARK